MMQNVPHVPGSFKILVVSICVCLSTRKQTISKIERIHVMRAPGFCRIPFFLFSLRGLEGYYTNAYMTRLW